MEPQDDHLKCDLLLETKPEEKPSIKLYEVKKFLQVVASGPPSVLEALFVHHPDFSFSTRPEWNSLYHDLKHLAVCTYAIGKFLGQAKAHFPKSKKKIPKQNPLDDVLRLLFEARRLLKEFNMKIYLNGEERETILRVRRGEMSQTDALNLVKQMIDELEPLSKQLPYNADMKPFSKWLVQLRRTLLQERKKQQEIKP
jgi:hypothetical protein